MNKSRLFYIVLFIVSLVFYYFSAGYIPAMLVNVLTIIFFADIIWVCFTAMVLKMTSQIGRNKAVKEESILFELILMNKTPFILCPVEVLYLNEASAHQHKVNRHSKRYLLFAFSKEVIEKPLVPHYRGVFKMGVSHIKVVGFFNLFSIKVKKSNHAHQVLVYPQIYKFKKAKFKDIISKESGRNSKGNPFDEQFFTDIKEYQPGDSLNRIHWKLSAKHQALMSKEYSGNAKNSIKLIINTYMSKRLKKMKIPVEDYMIEGAVAMCKHLLEGQNHLEVILSDAKQMRLNGNNSKDFTKFYEYLARVQYMNSEESCDKVVELLSYGAKTPFMLVMLTPYVDQKLKDVLIRKLSKGYDIHVIVMNDHKAYYKPYLDEHKHKAIHRELGEQGVNLYRFTYNENICRMDVI